MSATTADWMERHSKRILELEQAMKHIRDICQEEALPCACIPLCRRTLRRCGSGLCTARVHRTSVKPAITTSCFRQQEQMWSSPFHSADFRDCG